MSADYGLPDGIERWISISTELSTPCSLIRWIRMKQSARKLPLRAFHLAMKTSRSVAQGNFRRAKVSFAIAARGRDVEASVRVRVHECANY